MAFFVNLLSIVFFLTVFQASAETFSLICPSYYEPTGLAWITEAQEKDSNIESAKKKQTKVFSICAICTREYNSPEVEICIGHEKMRNNNLVYERKSCSYKKLGYFYDTDAVGLIVDLNKKDRSSILKNIEAYTDKSRQSPLLSCPSGFQSKRFEERSPLIENGPLRPCLICSRKKHLLSFCVSEKKDNGNLVVKIPTLSTTGQQSEGNLTIDKCRSQVNLTNLMKGLVVNPYFMLIFYRNLKTGYSPKPELSGELSNPNKHIIKNLHLFQIFPMSIYFNNSLTLFLDIPRCIIYSTKHRRNQCGTRSKSDNR